ncbi:MULTISPECIES: GNAT family N-acetyltransferase [Streptomyces]|uniref:GNAT family N-acetyltransferase n=1 Tax=Streptomyces griseiscabiei TaxID=2993540 RepID=A0ABU4LHT3_9ACTN|nr:MULTISPECIES: GNAT family N-acetyltransferase [Streptomyces]MBZ3908111.1 GNAT family N-acetyltransferase [Streptomyces griseiscabiei]MDX2915372.1 GNAT family N-acetyltransferase [Streptomyces griseiscabiei]
MSRTDERPTAEPHGHGLRLCAWDAGSDVDVEAWFRGRTDPDFRRWNTPMLWDESFEGARESLRRRVESDAEGRTVSFRITDATTGATLGQIGLSGIDGHLRRAVVGYWVLPEARGRRVATRALDLATRWTFTELGIHRLELNHVGDHAASCRIAELCGFPYEGNMRGAAFDAGRHDAFRDAHLHARLATDPAPEGIWGSDERA